MFVLEPDLEGVNIVKKWLDSTKSRVTDLDEATARLLQYVLDRGNKKGNVDLYGPATDFGKQEQEALVQEQETQVQGQEEAHRGVGGTQVRTVAQESAFTMAFVEPVLRNLAECECCNVVWCRSGRLTSKHSALYGHVSPYGLFARLPERCVFAVRPVGY
jgi:hypothetical protein